MIVTFTWPAPDHLSCIFSECCLQHPNTPPSTAYPPCQYHYDSPASPPVAPLQVDIMLTETERAMRFRTLVVQIRSLREEINRTHDSEPADFAAFVAQIPVSRNPDWDVEESPANDVWNAWAAWDDASLKSDTASSPESSNAATAAAASSSPLSNERLDESNLNDRRSDASTLARLVQKFTYRPRRIKKDDGDGQPSAMQYLGQSSNGSPSSGNNGVHGRFDHGYIAIRFGPPSATDIRTDIRTGICVVLRIVLRVVLRVDIRKCDA
ncbi:hypothetical protein CTA2_8551 [Colletotrichum tanaceti]|uniref:Uncharacterized protein n=1 Tax=Colletotrichum tanaceti TaxID=1306861 RepID=A0A4U6X341_9PEZI|nr:hypothetical protein CTA2_8551 [Colletotrichum tanaceti]TKW49575.1 hypothetical protein CTA1_660 [Colletotrichum tanaceti]